MGTEYRARMSTETHSTHNEPVLPHAHMHIVRPNDPAVATVTKSVLCTAGRKAAGVVRHIEFDVSGTGLEGKCIAGQSVGVLAPGEDSRGRPHKPRLYSLASPSSGEDGSGTRYATTVKRTIDEHWDDHTLFLGVASNYLCDLKEGDQFKISGPNGKRFLLPDNAGSHDYIFFATGTGIAPFRGMILELLKADAPASVTLVMGAPYTTDLLYHDELTALSETHKDFTYLTAISREEHQPDGKLYVQGRLQTHAEHFKPLLESDRTLIYVCGIAGMELGILQELARGLDGDTLDQYLKCEPDALSDVGGWDRRMIHKQVKPTRRVLLEVYA